MCKGLGMAKHLVISMNGKEASVVRERAEKVVRNEVEEVDKDKVMQSLLHHDN